jgi:hypothetical protein
MVNDDARFTLTGARLQTMIEVGNSLRRDMQGEGELSIGVAHIPADETRPWQPLNRGIFRILNERANLHQPPVQSAWIIVKTSLAHFEFFLRSASDRVVSRSPENEATRT